MKNLIQVTEQINKDTDGSIYSYTYHAPTHWVGDGIVKVYAKGDDKLRYGSGGTNAGFSDIIIADVMRQAFEMAQKRLIKLESK